MDGGGDGGEDAGGGGYLSREGGRGGGRAVKDSIKFIDLYLSRQACKLSFIRVTDKFLSFPFKFIFLGGGDGGG